MRKLQKSPIRKHEEINSNTFTKERKLKKGSSNRNSTGYFKTTTKILATSR